VLEYHPQPAPAVGELGGTMAGAGRVQVSTGGELAGGRVIDFRRGVVSDWEPGRLPRRSPITNTDHR